MRSGLPGAAAEDGRAESRSTTGRSSRHTTGAAGSAGRAYSSSRSSMRSTNSVVISGTHHIFFPPRLEPVAGKRDANGLSPDLRHDPSPRRLLGDEGRGPDRAPL